MDNSAKNILVVDDDDKLRDLVIRYLSKEGFSVTGVADGTGMDRFLDHHPVDLIVLDLMLPGEDGLSIARRLRTSRTTPIVILSARGDEVDRIVGLEVGADDYLPKPFNPRELLARIRAVLRRSDCHPDDSDARTAAQNFTFGSFTLDVVSHSLVCDDEVVDLTPGDFALLEAFVSRPNRIMTRDNLIELLKGYERSPYDRSIDVRVTRLRRKIEPNPEHPQYIRTVWGKGYMFTPQGNPVPQ
jgi:two-component system phosphate regulon response regulator OmpR